MAWLTRSILTIAFLTTALVVSGAAVDHATASSRPATVTAIGDSYLAGIGAGDYTTSEGCRRSQRSAPALLARSVTSRLVDLTCPGGTILDSSRRAQAVPPSTDVVIIQAGGNDIGFAALAGACFLAGSSTCLSQVREGHRRLPDVRRGMLGLVRQVRLTAPTAEVIVLGYPRLLGPTAQCRSLLDPIRVRAVDRLQRTLDRVIRSAGQTAGATFLDWPRRVDRSSLCSVDPWYALAGSRLDDLLHPDERAHRALFRHLAGTAAPALAARP